MGACRAFWFRCDLRLDDNPALLAAVTGASSLLPVYVFDRQEFNVSTLAGARKSSARRARFLLESVGCLRRNLEKLGSGLVVLLGKPEEVLPKICKDLEAVYVTQGVCSEEKKNEARLTKALKPSGCQMQKIWGGTLFSPEDCGGSPDRAPLLFTAFKNQAESRGHIRKPSDSPQKLPPLPNACEGSEAINFLPTLLDLGFEPDEAEAAYVDDPRACMTFEGGENAALRRLQKWMFEDDKLRDYFQIRNGMLGDGYSSKLSPWLALGCISPRRIWSEAKRYESQRIKNKSTYWLIFELTWRDFFVYMARSQGNKIFMPGGVTGERGRWRGSEEALQRWKDGCTKDPLVDANMRELKATGFMSNRGRQNVASYLIFDLGVDWRYGAAHFEEHLLDYDPCSNWGNWVAAAGLTGQRVNRFNTRKQLSDYDPGGDYVRHWQGDGPRHVKLESLGFRSSKAHGSTPRSEHEDEDAKKQLARLKRFAPATAETREDQDEARKRARLERFGQQQRLMGS
eukprot:TRINITY_DN31375_c0_g1_i1.p1 TRINITY_DN31375_c0_g1~~TRINITY_DN31375_c0_g1_i1.p1  ORF type:complete len:513 (+),score=99.31 TRINITY_DN31375_c0_g1_i1:44-1582(+)